MRARERQGAAALRAVGAEPSAEYRAQVLTIGDRPAGLAAPWLVLDGESAEAIDDPTYRGVVDAMAVRLRYSDRRLHRSNEPGDLIARLTFDMLEQIRCEACVPDALAGVRENIEVAFRSWNRREQMTDTALGVLLFTVLQMARNRLVRQLSDEAVEETIEQTRANISPIIGTDLFALRSLVHDQAAYAVHARAIGEAISEFVGQRSNDEAPGDVVTVASQLFVPPEWFDSEADGEVEGGGTRGTSRTRIDPRGLDTVGGYHVFTRDHDVVHDAAELYPLPMRQAARERLDGEIQAQAVSVFTLARRLQRLLRGLERDGWSHGHEEGVLDPARLSQIVANPAARAVFRQDRWRRTSPACVTFLVDNSGSMKRQRFETVTVLVDTLARALDLAGATSEILGFTTNAWNGGAPRKAWHAAGQPSAPGRLSELSHIVYKDADTPWKRARHSIASMMRTQHYREGVDGEAITWAYRRLLERPEPLKLLLVVSDGAPMETSTINANGESFLDTHLTNVIAAVERDPRVRIGAIAIDQAVDSFFADAVEMDLSGTLTLTDYRVLEVLFGG